MSFAALRVVYIGVMMTCEVMLGVMTYRVLKVGDAVHVSVCLCVYVCV